MTYLIILIIALIIGVLIVFPKWQVKIAKKKLNDFTQSLSLKDKLALAKDLLALENTYRVTISQIIGGAVVVLSIYFSIQNLNSTQKSLELSQEGQITDRFTKAVNQLGDKNTDINIGGIFALQRIAHDSEKDYWPVMEILTAYVRRKVPLHIDNSLKGRITDFGPELRYHRPPFDIQAVMTVLAERNSKIEKKAYQIIHLEVSFLQGIVLDNAHLENASFMSTNLKQSSFRNAVLDSSFFNQADLTGVDFENASMRNINLFEATLCYSNLNNVHLENADLTNADLRSAAFRKIYVAGAKFTGTRLGGLDLRDVIGLTHKQILVADTDEYTLLPKNIK